MSTARTSLLWVQGIPTVGISYHAFCPGVDVQDLGERVGRCTISAYGPPARRVPYRYGHLHEGL